MRASPWQPLPLTGEGTPDIFGERPLETREAMFTGFMSGVGQVIRAASGQPVAEELIAHTSLPMFHILDEIEKAVRPEPRSAQQQALFDKVGRLQQIASEADRLFSWLPREIEITLTDDDSLEYMIGR
jgi:hypothetical protein